LNILSSRREGRRITGDRDICVAVYLAGSITSSAQTSVNALKIQTIGTKE
jgi:hypothetical protein